MKTLRFLLIAQLFLVACNGSRSIEKVPETGNISIPGMSQPVQVVRDEFGRPHVYAETETDLTRVQGYLHASDRFVQMDFSRRFASGRLAELAGAADPSLVDTDYLMRVIGLARTAEAITADLTASQRETMQAYTDGVNAYIQAIKGGTEEFPVDYSIIAYPATQIPEWTLVDTLTVGRLLSFNLTWGGDVKVELQRAVENIATTFGGTAREGLTCDLGLNFQSLVDGSISNPDAPRLPRSCAAAGNGLAGTGLSALQETAFRKVVEKTLEHKFNLLYSPDRGSNNWVVSAGMSQTGHPILADDPHLGLSAPSIWYQIHLNTKRAGGALDVIGVSLPGVPGMIIGHNGQVAWGVTNVGPDVTDNYIESYSIGTGKDGVDQVRYDPGNPGSAGFVDLVLETETIEVRTGAGVTVENREWYSVPHRNGAIIPGTVTEVTAGVFEAISWRWTGFDVTHELTAFDGLARASNAAEVNAALSHIGVPPQNFVYATRDGDIGWNPHGLFPIRADNDGNPYTDPPFLPLPGTGSHEWVGFVGEEDIPRLENPVRGWIESANQDLLGHNLDNDPLNDSPYIGYGFYDVGFRGKRIDSLLMEAAAQGGVSVEDMFRIQMDHKLPLGTRLLPVLLPEIAEDPRFDTVEELLTGWGDRGFLAASGVGPRDLLAHEAEDSTATTIMNVWMVHLIRRVLGDEREAADLGFSTTHTTRMMVDILERPQDAATWDAGMADSILFDDLNTTELETRTQVIRLALTDALNWLASEQGFASDDPSRWTWGTLHTLRLPRLDGISSFDIPSAADPNYPNGFPHHGDAFVVDASQPGLGDLDFSFGSGPSVRMVVDATPDAFRMYMSFPGGTSADPASEHYADQVHAYIRNEYDEFWYDEVDVAEAGMGRTIFR